MKTKYIFVIDLSPWLLETPSGSTRERKRERKRERERERESGRERLRE